MAVKRLLLAAEDVSVSKDIGVDEDLLGQQLNIGEIHLLYEYQQADAETCAALTDETWVELYPDLQALAHYLVHKYPLPCWRGQEDDLAEDIVQETIHRVIERAQKAERGEASPIQSLKKMATTVAYNYYRNLKRHDYRLSRLETTDPATFQLSVLDMYSEECSLDSVADRVDRESLYRDLAVKIGRFPPKQKHAILTDIANRMYFDAEPTALQAAFLAVGIELRSYHKPLPEEQRERSRHISLCSQAYKRLRRLLYLQECE